mmetsp:Transcript_7008/g.20569  ORF Transcript_7008/g.20569 Transcript_7008/m.20569 type:complete len:281 (-) Transcript_7008:199-1041(-)
MGLPKNALAFPPKLEDYKPTSWFVTGFFIVTMLCGWVCTWLAQMLFTYTVGLTMPKKRVEYWCGYLFRLLAAAPVAKYVPGISVEKTADSYEIPAEVVRGEKPMMIICNHRSYMDPFALAAAMLPLETKYVAKSDLFKVPFGGWAMQRAGDLAVRFDPSRNAGWGTVKGSTGQLLAQAAAHFEAGNSVAIFPEGNRMGAYAEKAKEAAEHPSKLMLFKPPFFDLCKKLSVPVVCVSMLGTDEIWPAVPRPRGNVSARGGGGLGGGRPRGGGHDARRCTTR